MRSARGPWFPAGRLLVTGLLSTAMLTGPLVTGGANAQGPATISGRVTSAGTGAPLQGIVVTVAEQTDAGFSQVASTTTGSDGRYSVSGLNPTLDHRVDFTDPADQTSAQACQGDPFAGQRRIVPSAQVADGAVVDVALVPGATVFGRVTANHTGAAVEGVQVTAIAENVTGPSVPAATTTDPSGRYWICELPRDRYRLHLDPHPSTRLAPARVGALELDPRDHVLRDVALLRVGSLAGKVTETPGGGNLPGATVTLLASDPLFGPRSTRTAADGTYRFANLRPDTYRIRFQGINHNHVTEFYNDREIFQQADPVRVHDNQSVTGIDAAIAFGASVSGVIRGGGALLNCEVFLLRDDRDARELVLPFAHPRRVFSSNGSYSIGPVAPGRYVLGAGNCASGEFGHRYRMSASDPHAADEIVVPPGDSQHNIDLQMPPAGLIAGRVRSGSGHGLGGICVWAHHADSRGTRVVAHTRTAPSGDYVLALSQGRYAIEFEDCAGGRFATQFYLNKPDASRADLVSATAGERLDNVSVFLTQARPADGDTGTGSGEPGGTGTGTGTGGTGGDGGTGGTGGGTEVVAQVRQTTATLDKTVVEIGDQLTGRASGFASGTVTTATVSSDPVVVGSPSADGNGDVELTFTITDEIGLGEHRFEIAGQDPDGEDLVAVANFQVVASTPAPTPTPTPTPPRAPGDDLPRTGADLVVYGTAGTWSIFVGLMFLTTARRRREQQDLAGYI